MSPSECRDDLTRRNKGIRTIPEEGTILYSSAAAFRGMIDAYLADGNGFLARNDTVNAYASYWYALGWMDAGIFLGLISGPASGIQPDLTGSIDDRPGDRAFARKNDTVSLSSRAGT